jgi:hypothetical protein
MRCKEQRQPFQGIQADFEYGVLGDAHDCTRESHHNFLIVNKFYYFNIQLNRIPFIFDFCLYQSFI